MKEELLTRYPGNPVLLYQDLPHDDYGTHDPGGSRFGWTMGTSAVGEWPSAAASNWRASCETSAAGGDGSLGDTRVYAKTV